MGLLSQRTTGGVLDFFNTFSGGSLSRMSLIALGVMPYITASIVVQLSTSLSPQLAAIKKEGESGRKKLNQYNALRHGRADRDPGLFHRRRSRSAVGHQWRAGGDRAGHDVPHRGGHQPDRRYDVPDVAGEQITSRGIGNGVSLIIMAGIVAHLPTTLVNLLEGGRSGSIDAVRLIGIIVAVVALILFICFHGARAASHPDPVPKRQTQRGMQADRSHLPLKINTAGVIPPIFASSLLLRPLTISQFAGQRVAGQSKWGDFIIALNQYLAHGQPVYMALYAAASSSSRSSTPPSSSIRKRLRTI